MRRAATALLDFATNTGRAALAREAAQELVNDRLGAQWSYPHFILGKCARMTSDLDVALRHYSAAETSANDQRFRTLARYERASVLFGLGRRTEADAIYTALAQEEDPATRAEARTALALGVALDGDLAKALTLVDEAASIAAGAGLVREEAEAWQARAEVLSGAERWEEARDAIGRAHSLRYGSKNKHTFDVYGWFNLLSRAFSIERALKHKEGAQGAAHGLWRFAVMSGSIGWEANAAHAMCLVDPDPDDEEVVAAVCRLEAAGHETSAPIATRLVALEALVLCRWSLQRYEAAVETIVEILAIGVEHKTDVPVFGHLVGYPAHDENIVSMPGGGYGLLVPPGETPEFIQALASRVFERRPELAKYAAMLVGDIHLESGAAPMDEALGETNTDGGE